METAETDLREIDGNRRQLIGKKAKQGSQSAVEPRSE